MTAYPHLGRCEVGVYFRAVVMAIRIGVLAAFAFIASCRGQPADGAPRPAPSRHPAAAPVAVPPPALAPSGAGPGAVAAARPPVGTNPADQRGPADVVIVPSAQLPRKPDPQGWAMGSWARGIARLCAREASPSVSALAVLPMADVDGTLSYGLGDLPLAPDGVSAMFQAYQPKFVVSLHIAIEDRLIEVVQFVWKRGEAQAILSRRYPWKLDDAGRMLDDVLDDLMRAVGGVAPARGVRIWNKAAKPEALESFLEALDVGTLRAAARGRPTGGHPRETADLLREALAADPGFTPARDVLGQPKPTFDRVIISERRLPAQAASTGSTKTHRAPAPPRGGVR